tara:strand:+ start:4997 stop:5269 length:273 start_codon:yes stop_codon:yes gene_type:complete
MKKDYNFAGPHSKLSTALELIMVHLESSYAHSTFAWIFVYYLKSARQIRQKRSNIRIKKFDDSRPEVLRNALGYLGHVLGQHPRSLNRRT